MRFNITFLLGPQVVATVGGQKEVHRDDITVGDVQEVPEVEAFLERLTGYRVHVEAVE